MKYIDTHCSYKVIITMSNLADWKFQMQSLTRRIIYLERLEIILR